MRKKSINAILVLFLVIGLAVSAHASDGNIDVFYTNDIHTYINNHSEDENALTYSKIAALKASSENSVLVDAGDHIQGTAYGGMDSGSTILDLMNAAGYDAATLGNHEFDYGMARCLALSEEADFPYVSCNFRHEKNGVLTDNVLDSFVLLEAASKKIAFVGITTPETITSTTPTYFQNDEGDYIYGIAGGEDGAELYSAVQTAIDEARSAGADHIIALGHLGVDPSSKPWTSRDVIANTTGLDAFIDGHSHTTIEMETVFNKTGDRVVLTQTGSYLDAVGKITISADGTVKAQLISGKDLADLVPDAEVKKLEDSWISEIDERLGETIGYAKVTLDNYDSDGNRLVRKQGTNSGDFSADALYYLFDDMDMDVDIAVMNGGGIRNGAVTGELTYLTCKDIHPFGNVACLLRVSGQQILDMLEWGSRTLQADGSVEEGSFLHVSGIRYSVDLLTPSTVQSDDKDIWTGGPTGDYRVRDVQVKNRKTGEYEALDLSAAYHLAGYNYTLRDLGGGFAMLSDAANVLDYVAEDYMVLANYVQSFPVDTATGLPTIDTESGYADIYGSGRITVIGNQTNDKEKQETAPETEYDRYAVVAGDCLWSIAAKLYGDGTKWTLLYEANRAIIQDPSLIFVGQQLSLPNLIIG